MVYYIHECDTSILQSLRRDRTQQNSVQSRVQRVTHAVPRLPPLDGARPLGGCLEIPVPLTQPFQTGDEPLLVVLGPLPLVVAGREPGLLPRPPRAE